MHKAHLFMLRNRNNIVFFIVMVLLVATLVSNLIILRHANEQADRMEQTLKGLSCVSLIKQESRTIENITNCIDKNAPKSKEKFQFNPQSNNSKDSTVHASVTQPKVLQSVTTAPVVKPIKVSDMEPVPIPKVELGAETRIGPISKMLEWRVVGEITWRICTGVCPP